MYPRRVASATSSASSPFRSSQNSDPVDGNLSLIAFEMLEMVIIMANSLVWRSGAAPFMTNRYATTHGTSRDSLRGAAPFT